MCGTSPRTRPRSRPNFRRLSTSSEAPAPSALAVVGGNSLIGSALAARACARGHDIVVTSRREGAPWRVDLAATSAGFAPPPARAVAICAALTDLRRCEADPAASAAINWCGAVDIARNYLATGARCVFLSTNQVFDGSRPGRAASESPSPASVYGRHKAAAEAAIRAEGGIVVRLTKIVHPELPAIATWRAAWRSGTPCEAFDDTYVCPVPLPDALDAIEIALERGTPGAIYQVSADSDASYFEFARELARASGVAEARVVAVKGAERLSGPAFLRPRYSSLDTRETEALGWRRPDWRTAARHLAAAA